MSGPVYATLEDLVPHDGLLDATELEEAALQIGARPAIWEPLVRTDPERRRYELIYEDERMDAWVLSWMPGQGTGFHDHFISSVGVCVVAGAVREAQLRLGGDNVEVRLAPGASLHGGPGYIHRIRHAEGEPAVTIHVYSPRLDWVGQYRVDDDGTLRREPAPGRVELTP